MDRGEIWHVDLEPTRGREQAKARYVLIITEKRFNALGTPVIVPITSGGQFARFQGVTVSLSGAGTQSAGVVLCNQLRAIDLKARGARYIEKVPDFIIDDVLARVSTFFE
ncbi:mRNA-degrading endonuclease toxin of MazEF toxin-antitoxin module [Pararhizobium capsulatum DSM 1112]|uniref:mRNA-degrading endonuclease toxin of MazEF toxin-antitoxin module n=1 Tax=Pararhizobium capsulatum DSM 1112 TaxID=1121113 RepID=A0ABU0BKU3_9HYPH|nr:type II toxin-antitoxin system PemK/MazF family toxin [Pararhizobium capsulatum]MDQ0318868.1 mRNA-degrading endonuclease toxin of MazEF toxin-antitoxin module [Pararhizobium capsulatum DSM 1112]